LGLIAASQLLTTPLAWSSMSFISPPFSIPFATPQRLLTLPSSATQLIRKRGFEFSLGKVHAGHGIQTRRHQITQNGIEVLGAVAMSHQGPAGLDTDAAGFSELESAMPMGLSNGFSTQPALDSEEASRIALGISGNRDLETTPVLKILPSESGDGSSQLIYWVTVAPSSTEAGRDILINAHQGKLIADLSHDIEIAPTEVLVANETCQEIDELSGAPLSLNLEACPVAIRSGVSAEDADETAQRANSNSSAVLHYYWNTHGRDSYDDQGSNLTSVVHVGRAFANAFWSSDRNFMAYGDGDGRVLTDLTLSLDVAGHEMTHGVTSNTSQLIYMSESGALNEAFSDFFGVLVAARERSTAPDWGIGKEIFANERKLVGLRNLKDPASIMARYRDENGKVVIKPYPAHVKDQFKTTNPCGPENDRCFVHSNSMIPGHAMVLISEAVGLEKSETLLYVTLTQYLTKTSNFKNFKTQTLKACKQLLTSKECTQVRGAFKEVGL